jgi:phage N-6-adenine-methyltransferase
VSALWIHRVAQGARMMFPEVRLYPEDEPNERYTPRSLFEPLHKEFRFTLDVCATAESAKCPRYFTKEQDGLTAPWIAERVWCNPPFSDIEPWVMRAWSAHAELVVMLVPATRTDQPWWQEQIEPWRDNGEGLTTRFLPGRIRFGFPGNPEGVGVGSPMFGCVLLIWGKP